MVERVKKLGRIKRESFDKEKADFVRKQINPSKRTGSPLSWLLQR